MHHYLIWQFETRDCRPFHQSIRQSRDTTISRGDRACRSRPDPVHFQTASRRSFSMRPCQSWTARPSCVLGKMSRLPETHLINLHFELSNNVQLLPGDGAIDVSRCVYKDVASCVHGPLGDAACRHSLLSFLSTQLKQSSMASLFEPHAPQWWSNGSVPVLIRPHFSTLMIWRRFFSLPKVKCSFRNVTPHDFIRSWPLKSNVVDKLPTVSISQGVLLSVGFLDCFI